MLTTFGSISATDPLPQLVPQLDVMALGAGLEKQSWGTVSIQNSGEYAYRALIPRDAALNALGEEFACNGQLYCGYGGYIITYPVEHREFTNIVAVRRKNGATWEDGQWVVPSTKDEMLRDFEG